MREGPVLIPFLDVEEAMGAFCWKNS